MVDSSIGDSSILFGGLHIPSWEDALGVEYECRRFGIYSSFGVSSLLFSDLGITGSEDAF